MAISVAAMTGASPLLSAHGRQGGRPGVRRQHREADSTWAVVTGATFTPGSAAARLGPVPGRVSSGITDATLWLVVLVRPAGTFRAAGGQQVNLRPPRLPVC